MRLSPISAKRISEVSLDGKMERVLRRLPALVEHSHAEADARFMAGPQALSALAALGQSTRLEIFRLLMRHEPTGLAAGAIAALIGCPQNTLSSHISVLARAGLVSGTREGRSITYRANVEGMRGLLGFLVTDCCGGHPELCGFLESTGVEGSAKAGSGQCGCRNE